MKTQIGKIINIRFGFGGYQDAMLGFCFDLGSGKDCWGVGDFWGHWDSDPTENSKWSKDERDAYLGATCIKVSKLMREAKVESLSDLKGIPIEATFEGNILVSWRILTEVM